VQLPNKTSATAKIVQLLAIACEFGVLGHFPALQGDLGFDEENGRANPLRGLARAMRAEFKRLAKRPFGPCPVSAKSTVAYWLLAGLPKIACRRLRASVIRCGFSEALRLSSAGLVQR